VQIRILVVEIPSEMNGFGVSIWGICAFRRNQTKSTYQVKYRETKVTSNYLKNDDFIHKPVLIALYLVNGLQMGDHKVRFPERGLGTNFAGQKFELVNQGSAVKLVASMDLKN